MCVSELKLSIHEQLALCTAASAQRGVLSLPNGFDELYTKLTTLAACDEHHITLSNYAFDSMLQRGFVSLSISYSYEPVSNGGGVPEVTQLVHMSAGLTVDGWVILHELVQEWLKQNTAVAACT